MIYEIRNACNAADGVVSVKRNEQKSQVYWRVEAPRRRLYANKQEKEWELRVEVMVISFTFRYLPFCVSFQHNRL